MLLLRGGGAGAVSLPDDQVSPSWSGSWAGVLLEEVSPRRAGPKIPCNTGQLSPSDLTLEMSDNLLPENCCSGFISSVRSMLGFPPGALEDLLAQYGVLG